MNWNGRVKAFTLSYDDGVESDRKLVKLLSDYGLKCTFNLNAGILDDEHTWIYEERFEVKRLSVREAKELYVGHEIACHGLTHLNPVELTSQAAFDAEYVTDYEKLTEYFACEPVGMAYPYGCYDDVTVERLRAMGFRYARTVWDSMNFELQEDLMRFRPTCHHKNEEVFTLIDRFLNMPANEKQPQLFYLWGHAYEFDGDKNWDRIERICEKIAGREDIFIGTNREVLL